MLEQQLINAFMKLTAKAGSGEFIRALIQTVDENGNPKSWSPSEMEHAIHFINHQVENFGKAEALQVIQTLIHKFDIDPQSLISDLHATPDQPNVQGLQ